MLYLQQFLCFLLLYDVSLGSYYVVLRANSNITGVLKSLALGNSDLNEGGSEQSESEKEVKPKPITCETGKLISPEQFRCTESIRHNNDFGCKKAFDGNLATAFATRNQGVGAWINTKFHKKHMITQINFLQRSNPAEASKQLEIDFGEAGKELAPLTKKTNLWNFITLSKKFITDNINISIKEVYGTIHNGFKEIQIFGCEDPNPQPSPCSSQEQIYLDEFRCTESIRHNNDYACSKAFDGNLGTDWATRNSGVGIWIHTGFKKKKTITKINIKQRQPNDCSNRLIEIDFGESGKDLEYLSPDTSEWNNFTFSKGFITKGMNITVKEVFGTVHNGFKEIQIFGCDYVDPNPDPLTCASLDKLPVPNEMICASQKAGSECEKAFDGDLKTGYKSTHTVPFLWEKFTKSKKVVSEVHFLQDEDPKSVSKLVEIAFGPDGVDGKELAYLSPDPKEWNNVTLSKNYLMNEVMFTIREFYGPAHLNGFREIILMGCEPPKT